ncbi:MAG TPA: DUF4383 domain-containing protein [Chthoniobacterales bacterium]|nr:DUF4383 domain-containing protein [Chthoniobacterales bacterium]
MAKTMAILFGVVFLVVGILGFVPAVTKDDMLLGIFHVNAAHNCVHLLSGVVALICGMAGVGASRLYFKIFGLVYGAVAVLGFLNPGEHTMLLGLISNNTADTWLHVAISAVSLIVGFMPASSEPA